MALTLNKKNNSGLDDSAIDVPTSLPKEVVKRVNALKNLQLKMLDIETKFYDELYQLECKYSNLYEPLYEQREKIVNGTYQPTEEESKWTLDEEQQKENETKAIEFEIPANQVNKGIPEFWLHAMRSTDMVDGLIQDHDEPILKHLTNITVKVNEQKPYGFTLAFHFEQNEFFTNQVLTKTYELTTDKDDKDPFGYDGMFIYKSSGCKIDWCKDKSVTVKLVKKKQKKKNTKTVRVITKEEKQESFFNFFEAPTSDGIRPSYRHVLDPNYKEEEHDEEQDQEDEELCEVDFEIGRFFKDSLIPRAVLYYTGELLDDNNFDFEDEENEDEDHDDEDDDDDDDENDDDDNDDDDDDDDSPKKSSKGKKAINLGKNSSKPGKGSQPAPSECKQN